MNITYIGHSGFSVELEKCVLLFDYFEGTFPEFPKDKPLYVFSSHSHYDHFNVKIFQLLKMYDSVTYILSYDIGKNFSEKFFLRHNISKEVYHQFIFIPERVVQVIDGLEIQTFHSTDEGVAFLVSTEGKHIYHAGDLHWWTWPGETKQEYEEMTEAFQKEIATIPAVPIDVAFLVLDPRQEENFWMGFDYFMRHTDTKIAYPIHFGKNTSVIDELLALDVSKDYRDRIMNKEFYNISSTNKEDTTMNFKFAHNNFNVRDLQKSLAFYDEALGLKEEYRKEDPDGSFTLVYLTDGVTPHLLELTELRDWDRAYDLGDNEFHLAFEVDDIHSALIKHKDMGCVCFENEAMGIYFIEDPDGYWLEIVPTE